MRVLIAVAAISVVVASAAVTVNAVGTNSAEAQSTAMASRYVDPFPGMAKSLKTIAKVDQATLKEVQALKVAIGGSSLSPLSTQLQEIHTVLGSSQGVFNILGELGDINNNTR